MPFEISEPVLAYLDWLFLYIRNHCSCVLDTDVQESFNRMKVCARVVVRPPVAILIHTAQEGYESRHVVYTIWRTAMLALSEDLEPTEAATRCIMALNLSALAVTEVPAAAHSFLTRGVHAGSLIITCVLIQELAVPIVPIDDLCDFFASDQVSI